jgi:hypothetical protein
MKHGTYNMKPFDYTQGRHKNSNKNYYENKQCRVD